MRRVLEKVLRPEVLRLYFPIIYASVVGFALSLPLFLFGARGKRAAHKVARFWARACLRSAGVKVHVENRHVYDAAKRKVIVANHNSYLDALIVLYALEGQFRFVAMRELLRWPVIGWYMYLAGHYLIDRSRPMSAGRLLYGKVAKDLQNGENFSVLIFPEGQISNGQGGRKKVRALTGAWRLAQRGQVPVQTLLIFGSHYAMPEGELVPRRGSNVRVYIEAIEADNVDDHHTAAVRWVEYQLEGARAAMS
ncbi:MAG: lysophospholipid acyltransferase family protein [Candidatus Harrisonbacteria bacterium]|nr:lysophospholipid acyltransferase family protein [Candidatus Harrisonbacteria bacterium]